jgi:DNA-binding transcriptional regulator YhcF (GntR family)
MIAATKKQKGSNVRTNEEKWTPALMKAGWTVIPQVILDRQNALGIDAIDLNIILHIIKHWWNKNTPPFPSKRSIAECMQIDESTVRRRIARMEKDGLMKRRARFDPTNGQKTNEYLFDGLIKEATPYAREMKEQKDQRTRDADDTRRRTRALRIVKVKGDGK